MGNPQRGIGIKEVAPQANIHAGSIVDGKQHYPLGRGTRRTLAKCEHVHSMIVRQLGTGRGHFTLPNHETEEQFGTYLDPAAWGQRRRC